MIVKGYLQLVIPGQRSKAERHSGIQNCVLPLDPGLRGDDVWGGKVLFS